MPQARYTVTTARPAAEVFAYVADGENASEWRPGVRAIRKVSGEGVGSTYEQQVSGPCNRPVKADYRLTEYQPNNSIAFETISGPVRPAGSYTLREVEGGTEVTFALSAELRGLQSVMKGSVQKTMDGEVRNLDRMKERLEST